LEKNSGRFCNNSVHGWWWWCCCVGFMVLLVERWAEPGCGSSCTGLLPAAARDCWILRRMIWNGVIWCGNNTDEVDDGPLQRATILQLHRSQQGLSHLPHLMLILHFQTWIPKVWCVRFPSFFAYLLNLHLFTKPSSDNLLGLGGDDSSNDKVQSDQAVDKRYWHFGRGENGTSLNGKSSKTLRKTCHIFVKFQRKFNHVACYKSLHLCKLAKDNSSLKIHKVNPPYMNFENMKGMCVCVCFVFLS
jgi:hypothetical protein